MVGLGLLCILYYTVMSEQDQSFIIIIIVASVSPVNCPPPSLPQDGLRSAQFEHTLLATETAWL